MRNGQGVITVESGGSTFELGFFGGQQLSVKHNGELVTEVMDWFDTDGFAFATDQNGRVGYLSIGPPPGQAPRKKSEKVDWKREGF